MEKNFYTPSEVRRILGVRQKLVYELLKNGTLPSIKLGNQWKIPRAALTEWIAETTRKQTEERRRSG